MTRFVIDTPRLRLEPKTLAEVRAQIALMDADQRAELSADWLAQLDRPDVDVWTLGFAIILRGSNTDIGTCGFKGPPGPEGIVEIAYGLTPDQEGRGFATEAASALVTYAFNDNSVRLVRAHTFAADNASARVLTKCGFTRLGQVMDPDDGLVWRWERPR